MKSIKKALVLSVAAILSCSSLAGCGGDDAVTPTQTSSNSDKPYEGWTWKST